MPPTMPPTISSKTSAMTSNPLVPPQLLFAPPQGPDALPGTAPPPASASFACRRDAAFFEASTATRRPRGDASRSASESQVRCRPVSAIDVAAVGILDELGEDQFTLSMNLLCLERVVGEVADDAESCELCQALACQLEELAALRDVLAEVHTFALDGAYLRLFTDDAPLADYMRGLYAWSLAVVRALVDLAVGFRTVAPDGMLLRRRVEEARNFYFDELEELVAPEVALLDGLEGVVGEDSMTDRVSRLFATAATLAEGLDARFA